MQALDVITDVLTHDTAEVRAAACICLKSVSRSVKVRNLNSKIVTF